MDGRDGQPFHFLYFQLTAESWKLIWLRGLNLYFGRFAISNNAFQKKRFALFIDANQCNCRWTYKLVMKCKYCFFLFHSSYRPQDPGTRSMCKSVMVLFVFVMTFFEDCFDFLGTNSPFIAVTKQSGNSWFSSSRKLTFCRRRALAFSGHRVWFSEEQEIISAIYWEYIRIYTADWRLGKFKIVRMKRRKNVPLNTYYHLITT